MKVIRPKSEAVMRIYEDDPYVFIKGQRMGGMKMPRIAKTEIGLLLARLREVGDVKQPNLKKQRAAYLKKVQKLVESKAKERGV